MKRRDVLGSPAPLSAATAAHDADSSARHSPCPSSPTKPCLSIGGAATGRCDFAEAAPLRLAADRQQAVKANEHALSTEHRFLDMVNHELRSPLQRLVAATESLAQEMALGGSHPQNTAAIGRIRRAIWGLQAQLRDLLTIARSGAGEPDGLLETFDCSELVRDVCGELEDAARAKGLALNFPLPIQPQVVHADPIRIAQVLRNLLQNAVLHTSAGRIDVTLLAPTGPDGARATGWMRFTVSDSGPGLSAENILRLRSERAWIELSADPSPQNLQVGLLFVVRDLLRQLGGHIEVCSALGQSTVVSVQIPVSVAADALATGADAEAAGHSDDDVALQVLIVDNRKDVLHALHKAVRQLGHRCDVAASAAHAEPLLARLRYDTVLIELELPGKNGLAFALDIRRGTYTRSSVTEICGKNGTVNRSDNISNTDSMLILISAPRNHEVGQRPPFDGFLQKPIGIKDLKKLIGSRTRH